MQLGSPVDIDTNMKKPSYLFVPGYTFKLVPQLIIVFFHIPDVDSGQPDHLVYWF